MLTEKQINHIVMAAIARHSSGNNGKRGLSRKEVTSLVTEYGGDEKDVNAAMIEGFKRLAPEGVRWRVC